MPEAKREETVGRRGFLKTVGVGASVAASTPLLVTGSKAMTVSEEEGRARYQESEHVKTFYRVNGYES